MAKEYQALKIGACYRNEDLNQALYTTDENEAGMDTALESDAESKHPLDKQVNNEFDEMVNDKLVQEKCNNAEVEEVDRNWWDASCD